MDMRGKNLKVALATAASIVGAGFASGREISLFFAGQGPVSYLGAAVACAGMGFLAGMIAALAQRTRQRTLPGMYGAVVGVKWGRAVNWLYTILLLLSGGVMLATGAQLGMLALPVPGSGALGMLITLLIGAAIAYANANALSGVGALLTAFIAVFYCFLAADGRPAPILQTGGAARAVAGFAPVALASGAMYAAFNITLAGGVICLSVDEEVNPARMGLYVALLLAAMLFPANAALTNAGIDVCELALPTVALAARWGTAGYYLSIFGLWIAVVTTLCASLSALREQLRAYYIRPYLTMWLPSVVMALLAMLGFEPLVNLGYPLMSWLCALVLLALIPFLPADAPRACLQAPRSGM